MAKSTTTSDKKRTNFKAISDEEVDHFLCKRWPSKRVPTRIMLDSGAFSAWRRGMAIDFGHYIDAIKFLGPLIDSYINLDRIAGKFGGPKTSTMLEDAAVFSFKNYRQMQKRGLQPMAVFHQGERWHWLEQYIGAGCTYVGIAPRKDLMVHDRMVWMHQVFDYLDRHYGVNKIRTHGLGLSSLSAAAAFPWHSYDSTSWAKASAYGRILVPPIGPDGKYDYLQEPIYVLFPVDRTRVSKTQRLGMFPVLGPRLQQMIVGYIESVGFSTAHMYTHVVARRALNTLYCQRISDLSREIGKAKGTHGERRFVLSTNTDLFVSVFLREDFHVVDRLLSFYDLVYSGRTTMRPDLKEMRKKLVAYLMRETSVNEYGRFYRDPDTIITKPFKGLNYDMFARFLP
jgi:hypothetical protein